MAALALSDYRRLVVKVGSSLLIDEAGELHRHWLETLADDIGRLARDGHEILIVSSGAIAIGSSVLGINKARARLEDLQAAAAASSRSLTRTTRSQPRRSVTATTIVLRHALRSS